MTLVASCDHWYLRLQALHQSFNLLQMMVIEDHPQANAVALVEIIGNVLDDMLGWLDEALEAGSLMQQAVLQNDLARTRQHLAASHNSFDRVMRAFFADLASHTRLADLTRLGRTQGSVWRQWALSVRQTVESLHLALLDANQACFACWMELAERNVSQPLLLPDAKTSPAKRKRRKKPDRH